MPLFLKPIFHEKVWGGSKLKTFGYNIPNERIGECWGISAHPNGKSEIENGPYAGQTLDQVWREHRELFGEFPSKDFPLMAKIVDANAPLSIHVHPDDSYAYENENGQYGKSECWYIIEADDNAEITIGTHAQSREEFENQLKDGSFEKYLRTVKVQPGDFYFVPAGTVHSIGAGILAYEVMQSSDISYRIYDYQRKLRNKKRELSVSKALDVMDYSNELPNIAPQNEVIENHNCTHIVSSDFFTMVKWEITGTLNYMKPREFCLISILEGKGKIIVDGDIFELEKGTNFVLTSEDLDSVFEGDFTLIISYI
ncbi:type I phosphomannose isomerase catalytic subunit [Staphylococcus saccharolyticus]|uniref:type I phosphomannose isomerase catalytic subunit n=1 Tax=Staphylococcus saccharolyticus TaxID=33028 RepID=UPI00102D76E3|nr:type I phosphomannose isomerase catalytic subunit [Staphylococcus saccharolyticus]MBL7574256.1 class I mannose-6-phosphate isomerase [Staphylococcus saccharolyticus]MBL7585282.1 class I mannose-6-phosphate isomerase [Staphylococcus saccharolyticus]MBL7639864.1 class I mannose-6-phosphate isomerase [Staphylococcus saccharolyticus]QRJ68884.1 class I mannose-6-phosphate isomerase [Staphylococcus saccharolyticus]TAA90785.1 mannose-6-phosphate isomerase [Staphylococcus saccharolyticus]